MDQPYEGYRWRLVRKAYDFFRLVEQEQRLFTLHDLHQATGYSVKTIKSYLTKRWEAFLTKHPSGEFTCQGLLTCPWERFAQIHHEKHHLQEPQHAETNQPDEGSQPHGWEQIRILLAQLALTLLALLNKQRGI